MDIRSATADDLDAIAPLFTLSRRSLGFLPSLHTAEDDRAFWRDVVLRAHDVRVAVRDGEVAGVIALHDGWVAHLYVHPDRFRQGVGAALIASAKDDARELDLWCFAQNESGLAFYRRQGFTEVERTDGSGNEEKCPDVHLNWRRVHRDI